MAQQTITAMFDSYASAAEAVRKLEATGVAHSDISVVSNDESHRQFHGEDGTEAGTGAGTGASLGTLLGGGAGLLAGLGMLAIPGLGPVVAAGWLAATLVGAGVGAAAGGLVGSLTGAGISHEDANLYAEGVRRGGTLVTVRTDDAMVEQVADILDRDGTVDLAERGAAWRSEGWSGDYVATDPAPGSIAAADASRAATYSTPGATASAVPGSIARSGGVSAEPFGDDASRATAAVTRGVAEPSVPLSDYGANPRSSDADPSSQRNRVRIYPGQS